MNRIIPACCARATHHLVAIYAYVAPVRKVAVFPHPQGCRRRLHAVLDLHVSDFQALAAHCLEMCHQIESETTQDVAIGLNVVEG